MSKPLFIGIGNPGRFFSRHNIGADLLSKIFNIEYGLHENEKYILAIGISTVNTTGDFLNEKGLLRNKKVFIFTDDLETPVGSFSIGENLSPRGHNGVRNLKKYLDNYFLIRIGIGRPAEQSVDKYVLDFFSIEDLEKILNLSTEILFKINQYNLQIKK